MAKHLVPIENGLGLILDEAILERMKIDRDTPLEVRVAADGRAIEIRALDENEVRRRQIRESAGRMMTIHEDVFRKLAQ